LALLLAAACGAPKKTDVRITRDVVIPQQEARSLITMTAEPTASLVMADVTAKLGVRIRIHAPPLDDSKRPPLNLGLVLDTSASMRGEGIANVKAAARQIVEQMGDRDRLTLIAFSSKAKLVIESTELRGDARADALAAIDKIVADGTTDLAGGMTLGLQQVLAHRTPNGIDRIVLLADGFPNDPAPIPSIVASAAANRVAVTTLGIGVEHSQEMLTKIAQDTGGVYRYAPAADEIASVFRKELLRMQTLVAREMNLTITLGPGVELGAAPWLAAGGRSRVIPLGDLAAGEVRDVIVPLEVPGHAPGLTVELLDADLQFMHAMSAAIETRSAFVGVDASDDRDAVAKSMKTDVQIGQARAEAAGAILQAIQMSRAGAVDQARKLLADAEKVARKQAEKHKDAELAELADRMTDLGRNLALIRVPQPVVGMGHGHGPVPPQPAPYSAMTSRPAAAPAAAERAIREAYEDASEELETRPANPR
jgi:Ca-activated chloride channel family protein